MSNPALDYLMSSGVPSAKFPAVGAVVKGRIRGYELQQQRDMETGEPKFWANGDPMQQVVFVLETDLRDAEIDDDDGTRKLYAKGQMAGAIRDAVRKSGHRGDLVGGTLAVKYNADGQPVKRGFNPPKEYKAMFEAPPAIESLPEALEYEDEPPF